MAGQAARGPIGSETNRTTLDSGTLARVATPSPQPTGHSSSQADFDAAILALQAELTNFGFIGAVDGAARARYDLLARQFRDELRARVASGHISWGAAAREAYGLRDEVMQLIRRRSTPVGAAVAQWLKPESPSLNMLVAKKTLELFGNGADFNRLAQGQRNKVFAAIVESAGKANPRITKLMGTVSRSGRGLLFLSVGISVYNIATAQDKVDAAGREGAVTGASIAGGMAGGALAGLACGPGAPVCVTLGAFIGGGAAAMGVDYFWSR